MSKRRDGGRIRCTAATRAKPANCSKCGDPGFRFRGERWLCSIHNRMDTMRTAARSAGKYVPTEDELTTLFRDLTARGMKCETCGVVMPLHGDRRATVSLQHDRSGRLRLICMTCNSRHDDLPGDSFYDLPPDSWRCSRCEQVLPLARFYKGRAGGCCIDCRKKLNAQMWAAHGKRWAANSLARKA